MVLPMPMQSPGAPRVMGIARIGGLRIHGNAGSRQQRGSSARPLAAPVESGALVSLVSEAIDRPVQEAGCGGELLAVRLESDPAGAR